MTHAPNRQPLHQSDRSVSFSRIERLARTCLYAQHNRPGTVSYRALFRALSERSGVFNVMISMGIFTIVLFVISIFQQGFEQVLRDPRWFVFVVLLLASFIGLVLFEWLIPMYQWKRAIEHGREQIARVTHVELIQRQGFSSVKGDWYIVDQPQSSMPFRLSTSISGYWIETLEPETEVVVLLHPSKNKVWVVLGPVTRADRNRFESRVLNGLLDIK